MHILVTRFEGFDREHLQIKVGPLDGALVAEKGVQLVQNVVRVEGVPSVHVLQQSSIELI